MITSFRTDMAAYLQAVGTAFTPTVPEPTLVVWSRTLGLATAVNRISAGDIPDVQRRRRDALAESVVTAAYP